MEFKPRLPVGSQIRKVGYPYYTFYMIEFAKINPDNGRPQFYTNTLDANGKLVKDITEDPKNALPILIGLCRSKTYRRFLPIIYHTNGLI